MGAELSHGSRGRIAFLTLAALGVVFGDIGTSPLYALRECFAGSHAIPVSTANVLGVVYLFVILAVSASAIPLMILTNVGQG